MRDFDRTILTFRFQEMLKKYAFDVSKYDTEAKSIAEDYAWEVSTEYMQRVDTRDPAEAEAVDEVYKDSLDDAMSLYKSIYNDFILS